MVRFLAQEATSGVLLLAATAIALIWANSPWSESYLHFWETEIEFAIGGWHPFEHDGHPLSLELWVNDALMVLFFFVVGLEIKLELVDGDLREPRVAALPAVAALGGMVVPAAVYFALNAGGSGADGWGIPMATDIAFAVGVLALLGPRVPRRLKLFVLTLAIVDDIGAILVIALFYTANLSLAWLAVAIGGLALITVMQRFRIWYMPVYAVVGIGVWYATFRSGVHATIAGVAIGLLTPAQPLLGARRFEALEEIVSGESANPAGLRNANFRLRESVSVASRLIRSLSPWTSFFVIPVFALANAGIGLSGDAVGDALSSSVTLGVILGLVVGKPVGIFCATWLAAKAGLASLPEGVTFRHVFGAGAVAGIGFTVALFISRLAFDDELIIDQSIIGILVASMVAALIGAAVLWTAPPAVSHGDEDAAPEDESPDPEPVGV